MPSMYLETKQICYFQFNKSAKSEGSSQIIEIV